VHDTSGHAGKGECVWGGGAGGGGGCSISNELMADLEDERLRAGRLRAVRDNTLMQRCVGGV
jgi:hypothetical protein